MGNFPQKGNGILTKLIGGWTHAGPKPLLGIDEISLSDILYLGYLYLGNYVVKKK